MGGFSYNYMRAYIFKSKTILRVVDKENYRQLTSYLKCTKTSKLTSYLKGTKTSKHSLFSLHLHYKNIQPLRWVLVHLLEITQHRRCQTGDKHAEDILSGLLTSIHKHTKYLKSCLLPSYFEIMASVSLGSPQGAKGSSELPGEMLENGMSVQCHSRKSNRYCQVFSGLILQSLTWWQINCTSL